MSKRYVIKDGKFYCAGEYISNESALNHLNNYHDSISGVKKTNDQLRSFIDLGLASTEFVERDIAIEYNERMILGESADEIIDDLLRTNGIK